MSHSAEESTFLIEEDGEYDGEEKKSLASHLNMPMWKIALIGVVLLAFLVIVGVVAFKLFELGDKKPPLDEPLALARYYHDKYPMIDGHNDLPWVFKALVDDDITKYNISLRQNRSQTDIPRLHVGRVGGQFWSVYVPCLGPNVSEALSTAAVLQQIDVVYQMVQYYPDDFELAMTAKDVERAHRKHKVGSLIGMEGGHCINNSTQILNMLFSLGARYMTLTHNCNTPWAQAAQNDGSYPNVVGLTEFGKEIVAEMNRLGMLVDLSHVAANTMHDALDVVKAPVIFSHSGAKTVYNHPRNVPDDVLERLPENGGVVMVYFVFSFLTNEPSGNLSIVLDHIDHIVNVAGIDHVGYGSDFDGASSWPTDLDSVSEFPYLTAGLITRGYQQDDIKKIIGGNTLRVLRECEKVASEMQK